MGQYRAPKGTQVSTVGPDGEAIRVEFKDSPVSVTDPYLDAILQGLAADESNVVRSVKEK
jgi:hypothetical protein